jgi:GxxExxY protein
MSFGETTTPEIERVATIIVDAAFKVHDRLGPGLLESLYQRILAYELTKRGLRVQREVVVPIIYDGVRFDDGLRLDLLVEDLVIVEVKAVEKHNPLHDAQLLTYLKLTNKRLGLLINFNVKLIKDGIKRIVR